MGSQEVKRQEGSREGEMEKKQKKDKEEKTSTASAQYIIQFCTSQLYLVLSAQQTKARNSQVTIPRVLAHVKFFYKIH